MGRTESYRFSCIFTLGVSCSFFFYRVLTNPSKVHAAVVLFQDN